MDDFDLTITEEDGPMTCIWKVTYGKGWMTSTDILAALKDTHYKPQTFRGRLHKLPKDVFRQRCSGGGGNGKLMEYYAIEGQTMPPEVNRKSGPIKCIRVETERLNKFNTEGMMNAFKFF